MRPDRQTLLFSATFKKRIERLCRDVLCDPVRVVVGGVGEASVDVTQVVEVVQDQQDKWRWLLAHLIQFTSGQCHTPLGHTHSTSPSPQPEVSCCL